MPLHLPSTLSISSSSRGDRGEERVEQIAFPTGWGSGKLFEWYKEPKPCKKIVRLQLRKDISGLHHRFIVLYMEDGVIHRFDRRPDPNLADSVRTVKGQPVPARDEHTRNASELSLRNIEETALCEIELSFPDGVDILSVIAACYSIAQDPAAKDYSLFTHNCFFFSWTILMVVSRHYLRHQVPSHDVVVQRCRATISKYVSELVDQASNILIEVCVDVISIFLKTTWPSIRSEMHILLKLGGAIPLAVLKPIARLGCKTSSYVGPRQHVRKVFAGFVQDKVSEIWGNVLARNNIGEPLDGQLWLEDLHDELLPILNQEVAKLLSENIAGFFAGVCTSETEQLLKRLAGDKRSLPWTRHIWGLRSVGIEVIYGVILAVHATLQNHPYDGKETHESMFDRVWSSARAAAVSTAETAVEKYRLELKEKDRDDWSKGWEAVLNFQEQLWDAIHEPVRKRIIDFFNLCIKAYAGYGTRILLTGVFEDAEHVLEAEFLKKTARPRYSRVPMTNADLQKYVQKMIKEDSKVTSDTVRLSMARIWKEARARLQEDLSTADTAPNAL